MRRFVRRWWRGDGEPAAGWHALGCVAVAAGALLAALFFALASRGAGAPLPYHLVGRGEPDEPGGVAEDGPGEPSRATLDALRPFPPRAVVRSWCRFQRAHGARLEQLLGYRPKDPAVEDAYEDLRCRYDTWHLLECARDPGSSGAYRDECMKELRGRIGGAAFATGRMPEPVAWWVFDRGD